MRRVATFNMPVSRALAPMRSFAQSHMPFAAAGAQRGAPTVRRVALAAPCGTSATLMFRQSSAGHVQCRVYSTTNALQCSKKPSDALGAFNQVQHHIPEEEKKQEEEEEQFPGPGAGYLPFPPPFHTINIMSLLLIGNLLCYFIMNWGNNDDWRDFVVEHFTLSHTNAWRIYPFLTHAFYQEHLLQLAIDCWLLVQFGNTLFGFLGPTRLAAFWAMTQIGGGLIHIARQKIQLFYDMDPLEVRGRCYGPNPFILGLVGVEGIVFRHLNFLQNPPVPFLVLTAFVMVIDIWRIFTTKPEEHGASTGGALIAYFFWALPTRYLGLDKLTARL